MKQEKIYPVYEMPGHLIRRLQQAAVAIFMEEMEAAGIDLTPVQYAALQAIETYPRIDQATLGGVIAYDRTTIGGVIDRLENKGLVRRTMSRTNRRVRQLVIEPEGSALLARVAKVVSIVQDRIVAPLDATERENFMSLMHKLTQFQNDHSRAPLRPIASSSSK